MKITLTEKVLDEVKEPLRIAHEKLAQKLPGESSRRQPVHTVYGGAHLFRADTAQRFGALALKALDSYAPDATILADALGLDAPHRLKELLYERVRHKLAIEPVEDFRLDFEDGYGNRPDEEEDQTAVSAAHEVARGLDEQTLPPFIGIRIKPLSGELFDRAIRTLDLFLTTLLSQTGGRLPNNFIITLPKVMIPEHVSALSNLLEKLEEKLKLSAGALQIELMIETTQTIIDAEGKCTLPRLVEAAHGRCIGAHFGVYDYTASCSITAQHQNMTHPACDFARHLMQVSLGARGIMLSDGATNIIPIPPHRASDEFSLTSVQLEENQQAVHRGWRVHFHDVRHSLRHGFYQGWDLHPAQLPSRYAAVYSFYLQALDSASRRLRQFIDQAARATLVGDIFDDAATGQGLLNFFLRGLGCGAISEEAASQTGLTMDELRLRSFSEILAQRRR